MKVHATIVRSKYMTTVLLTCGHRINVENSVYKKENSRARAIANARKNEENLEITPELELMFPCSVCNSAIPSNVQPVMLPTTEVETSTNGVSE